MGSINLVLIAIAVLFMLVSYLVKDKEDVAGIAGISLGLSLSAVIVTITGS